MQFPVDLIVRNSQPAGHAALQATKPIPIVTIVSGDPMGQVSRLSLARQTAGSQAISCLAAPRVGGSRIVAAAHAEIRIGIWMRYDVDQVADLSGHRT